MADLAVTSKASFPRLREVVWWLHRQDVVGIQPDGTTPREIKSLTLDDVFELDTLQELFRNEGVRFGISTTPRFRDTLLGKRLEGATKSEGYRQADQSIFHSGYEAEDMALEHFRQRGDCFFLTQSCEACLHES